MHVQVVAPAVLELPAGHASHVVVPADAAYVPALQTVGQTHKVAVQFTLERLVGPPALHEWHIKTDVPVHVRLEPEPEVE